MPDQRGALQEMFSPNSRFNNFGNALLQLHVQGFRVHSNTIIDVESPITAFCGLNGTGKSTLLQLAAVAYKGLPENYPAHYIRDYIKATVLDPSPYTQNASVQYRYCNIDNSVRTLSITRRSEWSGYRRRPERCVYFVPASMYIPKIEQGDFILRNAMRFVVQGRRPSEERVKLWTCQILGYSYNDISSHDIKVNTRMGEIYTAERNGITYSETNMGYGEGRTIALINALESLPEKSLVLIEEPEISLHPSAQHELGRYLVDVAYHRKHQIMLTTHSEYILETLPSQSRLYLNKSSDGIYCVPRLTALEAKSLMALGHDKALHVIVEDTVAEAVLSELIRLIDPAFLRTIKITPVGKDDTGSAEQIRSAIKLLQPLGLSLAAVRDADQVEIPRENLYKLPGALPPEKELFYNPAVRTYLKEKYSVHLDDFEITLTGVNHHEWFKRLATHINKSFLALISEAAELYARSLPESDALTIVTKLRGSIR